MNKKYLWLIMGLVPILLFWFIAGPIRQDLAYHNFADKRHFCGVPNSFDVLSNIPFIFTTLLGLFIILKKDYPRLASHNYYIIYFISVSFVGLGSGYYHWNPNSTTLIWDRGPMTVSFMTFCSLILSERGYPRLAKQIFWPLLIGGILSVIYWAATDDLRPYALVQFYPLMCLPFVLIKLKGPGTKWLWYALIFYILAKVFEHFDKQIFSILGEQLSGHSIKHLSSAVSTFMIALKLIYQEKLPVKESEIEEDFSHVS
jgi:hypothetical protein